MSRSLNDEHAKSIDISRESEDEEANEEGDVEEEMMLQELEEEQLSKFDVFASNSKDKDRVIHK